MSGPRCGQFVLLEGDVMVDRSQYRAGNSMMNLAPIVFCALIVAQQSVATITGDVVDGAGKPVVGADVVFSAGMDIDGSVPILERATTDESGRFSMAKPVGKRLLGFAAQGVIWRGNRASDSGSSTWTGGIDRAGLFDSSWSRLTSRTLNFRDNDGKPIAGLRVAPRLVRTDRTIFDGVTIPDEWLEAITVTTTVDGTAVISSLSESTNLNIVRATTHGGGTHFLGLPHFQAKGDVTLGLGRPARLAGTIRNDSGSAISGVKTCAVDPVRGAAGCRPDFVQDAGADPARR